MNAAVRLTVTYGALLLAIGHSCTATAQTAPVAADAAPTAHYTVVSDKELADLHGGFDWGGMTISFGADVRTYLNGELSLQTLVNWSPLGSSAATRVAPGLAIGDPSAMPVNLGGAALAAIARNNPVFLTATGQTAIIQATDGTLQNILINADTGISVRQQTDATITLSNYAGFADMLRAGMLANSFGRDIGRQTR